MITVLLALSSVALAQDTVEVGVIQDADKQVVQRLKHPKAGKLELGVHGAVMPFDPWTFTPNVGLSLEKHQSESLALSVAAGAGYGLKTPAYNTLAGPTYQAAPYTYRYLASVLGGVQVAPVYAKLAWNGNKVLHFDVHGAARAGLTVEQSVLPGGGLTFSPTVSVGLGARIFVKESRALRLELREDIFAQRRRLTSSTHLAHNTNLMVGWTMFPGAEE